jgi:nitrogen fixation NifU-like protein
MYTPLSISHFHAPRHAGTLPNADAIGRNGTAGHGPYMVVYLRIEERRIAEVSFQTYGCPAAIACGSWLCEWLSGKALDEAALVTPDTIVNGLGGLPAGKEHCPPLAIGALHDALRQLV